MIAGPATGGPGVGNPGSSNPAAINLGSGNSVTQDTVVGAAKRANIVTVGHSNHPIDQFIALLKGAGVSRLVDIRSLRGSNHNPQFNQENLAPSLEAAGIEYVTEPRLGGRRRASKGVPSNINGMWENASFHRYADYALGEDFAQGLMDLIHSSEDRALVESPDQGTTAIMCSEAVWWRCHRRIVADHLLAQGTPVDHLMPSGKLTPAPLTKGAVVDERGVVTYPAEPDDTEGSKA